MAISKLPTSASLKQVMDKFEEISIQDFSNLDVVVLEDLPDIVKNNQIVVITDVYGKVLIGDYTQNDSLLIEDKSIIISFMNKQNKYNISTSKACADIPLGSTFQRLGGSTVLLNAYIGVNGEWVKFSSSEMKLYKDGVEHLKENYGEFYITLKAGEGTTTAPYTELTKKDKSMYIKGGCGSTSKVAYHQCWGYDGIIPTSKYNKLNVNLRQLYLSINANYPGTQLVIGVNSKKQGNGTWFAKWVLNNSSSGSIDVSLDISPVDSDGYVCIYFIFVRGGATFYCDIEEISLT